jgi:hypothetical protein
MVFLPSGGVARFFKLEIYQYIPTLKKRSRLAREQKSSLISISLYS